MFKDDLLAGKRALISGGGTGLGKAMGHRFMELIARLLAGYRLVAVATELLFGKTHQRLLLRLQLISLVTQLVESLLVLPVRLDTFPGLEERKQNRKQM